MTPAPQTTSRLILLLCGFEVARVEQIDADNKPSIDLGGATLKRVVRR